MSTKQDIISDAPFKAWSFSSDFNFTCKNGLVTQQHADTTVYWLKTLP